MRRFHDSFAQLYIYMYLYMYSTMNSPLHFECHLLSISSFNLLGLFSTERGKRDHRTRFSIEIQKEEMTLQMQ